MTATKARSAVLRALQEGREVAAVAQLGDAQVERAQPGLEGPVAVTVALIDARLAALVWRRPAQSVDLE